MAVERIHPDPKTVLYREDDAELIQLAQEPVEVPFFLEPQSAFNARIRHASRGVTEAPEDLFNFAKDGFRVLDRDLSDQLAERRYEGYEAVETVNQVHFGKDPKTKRGFKRRFVKVPHGGEGTYRAARMSREGDHPAKRKHGLMALHGWYGRYESSAEQALPSFLRKYSQCYFNRVGTDAESAPIVREVGYSTDQHLDANIRLLEQELDEAHRRGVETFTLSGHSMGGMVLLSALDRFVDERPDLIERITGITLNNTTAARNIIKGSLIDRAPGIPEALGLGLSVLGRGMAPLSDGLKAASHWLPGRVARRAGPLRPDNLVETFTSGSYIESMLGHLHGPVITASRYRAAQNEGLAMAYDLLTMLNMPDRPNLKHLRMPTLVIEGKNDRLLNPVASQMLAEKLIDGRSEHQVRQLVFDTGHCTQIEAPNQINSCLYRFAEDPERFVALHGDSEYYRLHHDLRGETELQKQSSAA